MPDVASPNQVLTHAARAAAKQLNKVPFQAPLVAAHGAREGLWLEQRRVAWALFEQHLDDSPNQVLTHAARAAAKQPFQAPLVQVAARGAREGLWSE